MGHKTGVSADYLTGSPPMMHIQSSKAKIETVSEGQGPRGINNTKHTQQTMSPHEKFGEQGAQAKPILS